MASTMVQNLVSAVTWHQGFVHPCIESFVWVYSFWGNSGTWLYAIRIFTVCSLHQILLWL